MGIKDPRMNPQQKLAEAAKFMGDTDVSQLTFNTASLTSDRQVRNPRAAQAARGFGVQCLSPAVRMSACRRWLHLLWLCVWWLWCYRFQTWLSGHSSAHLAPDRPQGQPKQGQEHTQHIHVVTFFFAGQFHSLMLCSDRVYWFSPCEDSINHRWKILRNDLRPDWTCPGIC